jgi:hypothetical protein
VRERQSPAQQAGRRRPPGRPPRRQPLTLAPQRAAVADAHCGAPLSRVPRLAVCGPGRSRSLVPADARTVHGQDHYAGRDRLPEPQPGVSSSTSGRGANSRRPRPILLRSRAEPPAPERCGAGPVITGREPQRADVLRRQPGIGDSSVAKCNFWGNANAPTRSERAPRPYPELTPGLGDCPSPRMRSRHRPRSCAWPSPQPAPARLVPSGHTGHFIRKSPGANGYGTVGASGMIRASFVRRRRNSLRTRRVAALRL